MITFPELEEYKKDGSHPFPNQIDTDPEYKKTDEYALKMTQAIYSEHLLDRTGIPYAIHHRLYINRLYGNEQQPPTIYKQNWSSDSGVGGTSSASSTDPTSGVSDWDIVNGARSGEDGLDYKIISLAQRMKTTIHGLFDDADWDVVANMVDEQSGLEEKKQKYKVYVEAKYAKYLAKWREQLKVPNPEQKFVPKNKEELDVYESNQGFKLNIAMEVEKLIQHTLNVSDWDVSKKKYVDDAVECGIVGARDYICTKDNIVKTRYMDVANCIIQWSRHKDFNDSDYGAEIVLYPVSELLKKGFSKEELARSVKQYSGQYGNPSVKEFGRYDHLDYNYHIDNLESWKIPVLEAEWLDTDVQYQHEYTTRYGQRRVVDAEFGDFQEAPNKSTRLLQRIRRYEAKWIIGTNLVYDYGLSPFQHDSLTFKLVKVADKPIIERVIPFLDDMMFAWLRYQKGVKMASNAGYAVNARLLQNISIGGEEADVSQILNFMRNTGYLLYMDTDETGQYRGGEVRPIHEVPSGYQGVIDSARARFELAIRNIELTTGLSLQMLGASPEPDIGKAVTEISVSASQNTIKPLIRGIMLLKKLTCDSFSDRMRMLIRKQDIETSYYKDIVGSSALMAIKMAEKRFPKYGLNFQPRPTQPERLALLNDVREALKPGRDGAPQLEFSDRLLIEQRIMNGGNLNQIRMEVAYSIDKLKRERISNAREAQAIEGQKAMQAKQLDGQNQSNKVQMDTQSQIMIDNNKFRNDRELKLMEIRSGLVETKMKLNEGKDNIDRNLNKETP